MAVAGGQRKECRPHRTLGEIAHGVTLLGEHAGRQASQSADSTVAASFVVRHDPPNGWISREQGRSGGRRYNIDGSAPRQMLNQRRRKDNVTEK